MTVDFPKLTFPPDAPDRVSVSGPSRVRAGDQVKKFPVLCLSLLKRSDAASLYWGSIPSNFVLQGGFVLHLITCRACRFNPLDDQVRLGIVSIP